VLAVEGQPVGTLQFLLDGTVEARARGGATRFFEPVAPLGFMEVITGAPSPWSLRTTTRAVSLDLTVDECRTLLAENADLVEGLFRTMREQEAFAAERCVIAGTPQGSAELGRLTGEGLTPIEKLLALQNVGPFAHIPADELLHLANAARRITFTDGQVLLRAAEVPATLVLLDGELSLAASDGTETRAPGGAVVGLLETLGGVPLGCDARVTRSGIALRIAHDDLFEVIGERPAFLRRLFARLFGRERAPSVA
jgi:CRP-like cAMP-binding protein